MLSLALLVPLVSIPASWSAQERAAAASIHESTLAAHVRYLSDDLLEGRGPGSRGEQLAMKYVAAQFERIGLKPELQKFAIVGMSTEAVAPPRFQAKGKTLTVEEVTAAGLQQEEIK